MAVRRAACTLTRRGRPGSLACLSARVLSLPLPPLSSWRRRPLVAAPCLCRQSQADAASQGVARIQWCGPPRTPRGCGARPHGLARGLQRLPLLLRVRCFGWFLLVFTVGSLPGVAVLLAAAGCGWPRAAGLLPLLVLVLVWLLLSLRGWPSPPPLLVVPLSLLFVLPGRCGAPLGRIWWRGVPPALRRSSARGGWPLPGLLVLLLVCCTPLL